MRLRWPRSPLGTGKQSLQRQGDLGKAALWLGVRLLRFEGQGEKSGEGERHWVWERKNPSSYGIEDIETQQKQDRQVRSSRWGKDSAFGLLSEKSNGSAGHVHCLGISKYSSIDGKTWMQQILAKQVLFSVLRIQSSCEPW